ncbi:MAG: serine/threonine protein kinase, partial [Myxococcota bacterium]|nr:serine/threonine protein kinase [Myxococcota bacterium]
VFDNGVLDDGTPYLVMELLHGESLATRLSRLGPIALPEAVSILEQCCRALTRAHSLGIVHRDIKPENVYLAQSVDDDGYIVKVLDFGIAKVTSLTDKGGSSTRTGTLLGTPLYMSPEQARGLRSIDSRTDLYSLGLVAYTMLTGVLPFSGETLGDLLLQICTERLPSLRTAAPWLPPTMDAWFQRACSRQPEDRYPSGQAFVDGLRVAAGLSSPQPTELSPQRAGPLLPPSIADDTERTGRARGILPTPSTTAGGTVGTLSLTANRRARWVLVVAAGILGLAMAPIVVLIAGGRPAPAMAPGAVLARPQATAGALPGGDAASSTTPARLVPTSVGFPSPPTSSGTAPSGEKAWPIASRTATHAVVVPTPAPTANPPSTQRPTNKSTGIIDLGY